jgi:hypothetical protein
MGPEDEAGRDWGKESRVLVKPDGLGGEQISIPVEVSIDAAGPYVVTVKEEVITTYFINQAAGPEDAKFLAWSDHGRGNGLFNQIVARDGGVTEIIAERGRPIFIGERESLAEPHIPDPAPREVERADDAAQGPPVTAVEVDQISTTPGDPDEAY